MSLTAWARIMNSTYIMSIKRFFPQEAEFNSHSLDGEKKIFHELDVIMSGKESNVFAQEV